ncbi:MAG: hypothetical protein AB7O84_20065 [Planctomycetota bacterium]
MATDPGKWVLALSAIALGIGAMAWPWLPRSHDNPLPPRFAADDADGRRLVAVLQWHDHACTEGDVDAFRAYVTADYADSFARRLGQLGRALDGSALRAYVGAGGALGLTRLVTGGGFGRATADRACLVLPSPPTQRGAHGLAFAWDGRAFRLDAVEHQPSVDPASTEAMADFARRLLGAR